MNLEQLLIEKQKRDERRALIIELLTPIDFSKAIRRYKIHKYIAAKLVTKLNNKLVYEIRAALKEMDVIGINVHQYRWYKHTNYILGPSKNKAKHDIRKQITSSRTASGPQVLS